MIQDLVAWVGPLAAVLASWVLKRINSLERELIDHRMKTAEQYASRLMVTELETKLDKRLERIEQKIDRLSDKSH